MQTLKDKIFCFEGSFRKRKTGRKVLRKPFCLLKSSKKFYSGKVVVSLLFLLLLSAPLFAGNTAVQTVRIVVDGIAEISTGGTPEIYLDSSNAKEAYAEGSYSMTVNFDCNMTACMKKNLPEGLSLFVSVQSPSGDSFGPEVLLSEQERVVLKDISPTAVRDRIVRYRLICDGLKKYVGDADVTFTLVDL